MSSFSKSISFIGSGNMAEAIFGGLIKKRIVQPSQIIAADVNLERLNHIEQKFGIQVTPNNDEAVALSDIVVLAVKPQYFGAASADLIGRIKEDSLVISIMAGTTIETMASSLGHDIIVRSMPNTPAMVGEGMTVWTATPAVSETHRADAETILSSCGKAIHVAEEKFLDMATAINGSGPGYVFLILEAMIDAGVQMGFARDIAEQLVIQTVLGSAAYAQNSDQHLAQLRNQVTSPGGTTAAGLSALEQGNLRATLAKGIHAAYERSVELGKKA